MTQPDHFAEAVGNKQFSGRGFIHRFLFAFPESKAGYQSFTSKNVPSELQRQYTELINRLLSMPYTDNPPVIGCDKQAYELLSDYFNHLQEEMREGGLFAGLKEWASKQFARCLKIAAILHLCEYGADKPITAQEAMNGINISMWCENHALKAFSGAVSDSQEIKDAKYILSRLKNSNREIISKRDLLRKCQSLKADECEEPLELLEDMKYIKREITESSERGRPKEMIKINPFAF